MNPWQNINNPSPRVIDFAPNGDVFQKPVKRFINLKRLRAAVRKKVNPKGVIKSDDQSSWTSNATINAIQQIISSLYNSTMPRRKLKILTNCDKSTSLCRFLSCPNITDHCMLCEIKLNDKTNRSTKCEKFPTNYLITHHYVPIDIDTNKVETITTTEINTLQNLLHQFMNK